MRSVLVFVAWVLAIALWFAVTFGVQLGCSALWDTGAPCEYHCDTPSGPGPGNGR